MKSEHERNGLSSSGLELRLKSGWKLQPGDVEKTNNPSMTVQNQAFSIRDLLAKQSNGLNVVTDYEPQNLEQDFDGIDFIKAKDADLFDQEQLLIQTRSKVNTLTEKVKKGVKKGEDVPPSPPPTPPPPKQD